VQGNSGVYKVMGTFVLFVSFLSFNASSVQTWDRIHVGTLAGSNTLISASFSCFSVMAWKVFVNRFEMHIAHSVDGILAGCVAATAGAPPPTFRVRDTPLLHAWTMSLTFGNHAREPVLHCRPRFLLAELLGVPNSTDIRPCDHSFHLEFARRFAPRSLLSVQARR
jgi:hypothetical protein